MANAQEKLTLQKAVEIALKNNYSIIIAANESELANNNTTIGNAGMLPTISVYGSKNYLGNDTRQVYANDSLLDKSGVGSTLTASGIALKWTLFDGLKMFATYNKLQELNAMGELQAKIQIENDFGFELLLPYVGNVSYEVVISNNCNGEHCESILDFRYLYNIIDESQFTIKRRFELIALIEFVRGIPGSRCGGSGGSRIANPNVV